MRQMTTQSLLPAGTTRGFGEAEFAQVGKLIAEVVDGLFQDQVETFKETHGFGSAYL